jgi:hypothetical protein
MGFYRKMGRLIYNSHHGFQGCLHFIGWCDQVFENHLNVADYFIESESVDRGEFVGKVAERLGLHEEAITREKFIMFAECDMIGLGADSKRHRASEIKYHGAPPRPKSAATAVWEAMGLLRIFLREEAIPIRRDAAEPVQGPIS